MRVTNKSLCLFFSVHPSSFICNSHRNNRTCLDRGSQLKQANTNSRTNNLEILKMSSRFDKTDEGNEPTPKIYPTAFAGAIHRALNQDSLSRRIRSFSIILSFLLESIYDFFRYSLRYVIPTLINYYFESTRIDINKDVSLHIYSPNDEKHLLSHILSSPSSSSLLTSNTKELKSPVVLFVHGGGWGSGKGWVYSHLGTCLMKRSNCSVIVLNYNVYPQGNIDQQCISVHSAITYIQKRIGNKTPLVLMAHSSGAHICSLVILKYSMLKLNWTSNSSEFLNQIKLDDSIIAPDVLIFMAGVYHLNHHFLFEARRGVNTVSAMQPASNAKSVKNIKNFVNLSPSVILETMQPMNIYNNESMSIEKNNNMNLQAHLPIFLEGDIAASNIHLPLSETKSHDVQLSLPPTFIMASSCDKTVPLYSSIRFTSGLRRASAAPPPRLLVYDGVEHHEFISNWFFNNSPNDLTGTLDFQVGGQDEEERFECIRLMFGMKVAKYLFTEKEKSRAETAYLRDVLRILESVQLTMAKPEGC